MIIKAFPHIGIDKIKFGMKRNEVRDILGNSTEFLKSSEDKITTDDFGFCHVFYDEDNRCEAIEIFNENEVYIYGAEKSHVRISR